MTDKEYDKLLLLLRQYFPRAKQLEDKTMLAAYKLALEKYPYEAVKTNLVSHAAQKRFFPDVSELCGGLTQETAEISELTEADRIKIEKMRALYEHLKSKREAQQQ